MTRKDYILIAKAFQECRDSCGDDGMSTWELIRDSMINQLSNNNPKFDNEKFIKATIKPMEWGE